MCSLLHMSLVAAAIIGTASSLSIPSKQNGFIPTVKGTPEVIGLATDPSLNRDSCGSVRFQNRDFWTCRDSQINDETGRPQGGIFSSTASWSSFNFDGSPSIDPTTSNLLMKGNNSNGPYFPLTRDQCMSCNQCDGNTAGGCSDKTRYAIWPDSPPLVASGHLAGQVTAYSWIRNQRLNGLNPLQRNPSTSLQKMTYHPPSITTDTDALPTVTLVDEHFWPQGSFAYGPYGGVNRNGMAYLYGQADDEGRPVALAKVPADAIEDRARYQYWTSSGWSTRHPSTNDTNAHLENAGAGGQGTYYWHEPWQLYVWIGQAAISTAAEFWITTSPEPQGPWAAPVLLYRGEDGNASLPAYSLQAHPDMAAGRDEVYLTYTKCDRWEGVEVDVYSTPLIRVQWGQKP